MKKILFSAILFAGCGAQWGQQNPQITPKGVQPQKEEPPKDPSASPKNDLYYFKHGCDDFKIENVKLRELTGVKDEKTLRRNGRWVWTWEVLCSDDRKMRCVQRRALRCNWIK